MYLCTYKLVQDICNTYTIYIYIYIIYIYKHNGFNSGAPPDTVSKLRWGKNGARKTGKDRFVQTWLHSSEDPMNPSAVH